LDGKQTERERIEKRMQVPNFWDDQESAQKTVRQLKQLRAVIAPVSELSQAADDCRSQVARNPADHPVGAREAERMIGRRHDGLHPAQGEGQVALA